MASLRIIARALIEASEEYILDFPLHRKDCSFMSLQPGRLLVELIILLILFIGMPMRWLLNVYLGIAKS
jgi:hypothetical protein